MTLYKRKEKNRFYLGTCYISFYLSLTMSLTDQADIFEYSIVRSSFLCERVSFWDLIDAGSE